MVKPEPNACIICSTPLGTPRTNDDWQVFTVPGLGTMHYSCSKVFSEIKAEAAREQNQRYLLLARERING